MIEAPTFDEIIEEMVRQLKAENPVIYSSFTDDALASRCRDVLKAFQICQNEELWT